MSAVAIVKVAAVGASVARYARGKAYTGSECFEIITASTADESGYTPAESVTLWGKESLVQLRDFLNEVLEEDGEKG